jgi:hypothetical protein
LYRAENEQKEIVCHYKGRKAGRSYACTHTKRRGGKMCIYIKDVLMFWVLVGTSTLAWSLLCVMLGAYIAYKVDKRRQKKETLEGVAY